MADLREYRRRRDADRTPEPVPAEGPLPHGDDDVFVIQEHHARRLHYDVRFERDGVLVSWAVPKNLPANPGTIRLAVHTEDHPMEYARFEGEIPRGEYGGGQVTIWDRGRYETMKWTDREIDVIVHGGRVEGRFVFFRKSADDDKNWMVRRRNDPDHRPAPPAVVEVEGRRLTLTNLDKPLYPKAGFLKAEVIDYYSRIAPILLPHVADRPMTFRRYPNGVDGPSFFAKNTPQGTPGWVRTVEVAASDDEDASVVEHVIVDDLPTLVWAANLAAIELHVPQWRVGPRGGRRNPDLLVFDLDPGAPATIVECCRTAERIRQVLDEDGLVGYPKTSGRKGLQVYVPVKVGTADRTRSYAREVANRLAKEFPDEIVSVMAKGRRPEKIFVDWSQNNTAKTTVAPYSLRAIENPSVSTPVTWREVERCRTPDDLVFTAPDVLRRIDKQGDLWADLHADPARLPRQPR